MNGRLYDPLLHRFLSPDNYVQDPSNTQNFNRYGYVLNNPLLYTDENGNVFGFDDAFAAIIGAGVNVISNWANIHSFGGALSYFAVGAAAGVATYYGGPLAGAAVLGAGNNLISQIATGHVDLGQLVGATAISVATSYAGGALAGTFSPYLSKITSSIASPLIREALTQSISNAVTGFGIGAGMSFLSGNNIGDALGDGLAGAAQGAEMGLITGGIQGYQEAKTDKIGVFTGRSTEPPLEPGGYISKVEIAGTTAFRYVTEGEIEAIKNTGYLRGGTTGPTYFTKDLYQSASKAENRLSLPETPTHRIEFKIKNNPPLLLNGNKVSPRYGMHGKGAEFMTKDQVKVNLINWQKLHH
jgi:hypothetical protein